MQYILAFIWKYKFFFLFLVLEALSITLLAKRSYFQKSVITNVTDSVTGSILGTYSNITGYFKLKEENERLATENAVLWEKMKSGQVTTDTTTYFLDDTLNRQSYEYMVAKVISNSTNHRNNYIMLNKGRKHGITPDMAVINPQGIIGTVVSVSENFSWVMSVLNKNSKVSGKLNRLSQMGSVMWSGINPRTGSLMDIPVHVKVKKGDTITSSGYSYIFPEGVMIGTVESVSEREGEHFHDIEFVWSADLNSLTYVYIVKNLFREEQVELSKNVIDE
jgi:rod shape-determining protein MreC